MSKSLSDIFIEEVKKLRLRFPGAKISEKTGYGSAIVSEYLNKKKAVSETFLRAFCESFDLEYAQIIKNHNDFTDTNEVSDLNPDLQPRASTPKETILFGKNPNMRLRPEEYAEAFGDWKGLPIYNSPITASFIETYRDTKVMEPYYYLHDPRFKDCDFGAIITGDSMYPEIRHGDIVLCKNIDDKSFIVYGDIYYIVANNGLETCKYVNGHDSDDQYLMLVPRNEKIKPSPIKKDMLLRLYKLRGLIRGY